MTKILKIDSTMPGRERIAEAADVIRHGGLVAFPTETVYGLGANALDAEAVQNIFTAKGRPSDNPLIVHIADVTDVVKLATDVSPKSRILMQKFWPGPLTIVLKKKQIVPDVVTAGLNTVAIRMPSHPVALALIKAAGVPIAAPSANLSGKPSPTTAKHVIDDLDGRVDVIIDGGDTDIGVESTVIDMASSIPTLLRPGRVTLEELEEVLGEVHVHAVVHGGKAGDTHIRSPGMKYKHYAPNAEVVLVEGGINACEKVKQLVDQYKANNKIVAVMSTTDRHYPCADISLSAGSDHLTVARNIFKQFRELDSRGVDVIIVEGVDEKGLGLAIMNRLRKAAGGKVVP